MAVALLAMAAHAIQGIGFLAAAQRLGVLIGLVPFVSINTVIKSTDYGILDRIGRSLRGMAGVYPSERADLLRLAALFFLVFFFLALFRNMAETSFLKRKQSFSRKSFYFKIKKMRCWALE